MFGISQLLRHLSAWFDAQCALPLKTTLVLLRREEHVLLAAKKRGFGVGRFNGVGGKCEPGEAVLACAARECREEIGVDPSELNAAGVLEFRYLDAHHHSSVCSVFTGRYRPEWGEPTESEEMAPQWFHEGAVPFARMWEDDQVWLPRVLRGEVDLHYRFWFRDHKLLRFECLN